MTTAVGNMVYTHGSPPCSGIGLQWTKQELDMALEEDVVSILFDDEGVAEIASIFTSIPETGFAQARLRQTLNSQTEVEDWRVGEAIAEAYLVYHRSCYFPWPDGRDERKIGSSLPGADLVGFVTDMKGDCLVFGEVKTSHQAKYPPNVMNGNMGLKQQMKNLRDCEDIRDALFIYLGHRAKNASWYSRFEVAGTRYLQNKSDVHLYGVLIRDVPSHEDDLRTSVNSLAQDRHVETTIELLALYLPNRCIDGIGRVVIEKKSEDVTWN